MGGNSPDLHAREFTGCPGQSQHLQTKVHQNSKDMSEKDTILRRAMVSETGCKSKRDPVRTLT